MFIKSSRSGYTRQGEQFARGSFLMVFAHNPHKWEEQNNTTHAALQGMWFDVQQGDGFTIRAKCSCDLPCYYMKSCPVHKGEYKTMPKELSRKLYACVRHVSLRQLGHFMMGCARIAGQSVTVSGAYGSDGLPRDYEDLTLPAREKLVELPPDLAETFWAGGGHNTSGNEAQAMRDWARATFEFKGGKK